MVPGEIRPGTPAGHPRASHCLHPLPSVAHQGEQLMRDFKTIPATPLAAAIVATLQAAASGAHAAEPAQPQQLPKISVGADAEADSYNKRSASSPKYTQPLLDTPQTITVIPPAVIKQRGATP